MNKENVIEKLTPLVRNVFADESLVITEEQDAQNVEGWTSLSFMQLLSEIEKEFGFKFKIFELINLKNMGDIISAIVSHTQDK